MGATADGSEGGVKPEDGSVDAKHINLKVRGQDGTTVHFKIKKNTSLKKLMNAYCERANVRRSDVRFRLNGGPVQDDDTPLRLEMEEDDVIEVFGEQLGGHS